MLATLVLGLALRIWMLSGQSLSMDEVTELRNAPRGLTDIVRTADGFPPVYDLLLHGWLKLLPGELSARWLSLILGVVSVFFGWLLGRRIGGDAVGLGAALLLAVSPLHIWYSDEGRAYALYLLLVTVSLWALVRALDTDSLRDWLLYAGLAAVGMYVHYYFAVVVLVGAIIIFRERHGRRDLAKPLAVHAALGAVCLPLLWLIQPDLSLQTEAYTNQTHFGPAALAYTYVSTITGYTVGPSLRELHSMKTAEAFVGFFPWLVLMVPALAILGYHGWRVLDRRAFELLIWLIAAPVATTGILGLLAGVGYNVRYVVWVAIPIAILLGAGATRWRKWPVTSALAVLLGLFAVALVNRSGSDRYRNEDMRALSGYLNSQRETLPIFILSGYMAAPAQYYLGPEHALYALTSGQPDSTAVPQTLELIAAKNPAGKTYWLVYSRAFDDDPHGAIRDALEQRDHLRITAQFAGVVLYRGVTPVTASQDSARTMPRAKRSAS